MQWVLINICSITMHWKSGPRRCTIGDFIDFRKIYIWRFFVRKIFILSAILILTGCSTSPSQLGMSEDQWDLTSQQQQDQYAQNYKNLQTVWNIKKDDTSENSHHPAIEINIQGGSVMMPPFERNYSYQPVSMVINNDQCNSVDLTQINGNKKVNLVGCYRDHILYLDPSRYDLSQRYGSIQFNQSPLWNRGFTYHGIDSSGYARLSNANVSIFNKARS